jgi:hypothetical protein
LPAERTERLLVEGDPATQIISIAHENRRG